MFSQEAHDAILAEERAELQQQQIDIDAMNAATAATLAAETSVTTEAMGAEGLPVQHASAERVTPEAAAVAEVSAANVAAAAAFIASMSAMCCAASARSSAKMAS